VGTFGDKFRKQREKKGISLDDVSNVTKIGSRMLQAIEEEHFDRLPGGVFNKGFIRAYAKHLGLNDEEAVNDYLACLRQAQIDALEDWEPARPGQTRPAPPEKRPLAPYTKPTAKAQSSTDVEELPELQLPRAEHVRPPQNKYLSGRKTEIPWRLLAAAALVLILAIVLWTRHSRSPRREAAAAPVTQSAAAPVTTSAPVLATANQASPARPAGNTSPSSRPSTPGTQQPPPTQRQMAAHSPALTPAQPTANAPTTSTTTQSPGSANPPPPAKPAATLTLVIRASENSWISVIADGQLISQETLIAPAHTSFRASREITVKVGNAAGVSFLCNGKEIPAQGTEAEAKTLVFDSNGLRSPQPVAAQPATAP
jgi:cytoskeletal protein RodZ